MKRLTTIRNAVAVAVFALAVTACATTQRGPSEWDGLERVPGTRLDAVFLAPGAELGAYTNIMLAPAEVQFDRDWSPNRGSQSAATRVSAADLEAIRTNLAAMVDEIFRQELTSGGFQIVTEASLETLLVAPAIVNLRITAPDAMSAGRTRTYTASSGSMTLLLEARDAASGDLLGRAVDTRSGRNTGMMTITNRVTNTADARRAITAWAQALRTGLEQLRAESKAN
jgi:hypothetical protein